MNVDFSRILADGGEPPSRNGRFRVLAVGRLVAKKGFDVLVEAIGILADRGVPVEAVIVGHQAPLEPEVGPELERAVSEHGLDGRVHLLGPMTQEQLFDEYRRASAFCLPCRVADSGDRDGIPNVMVEAMACGLPVVGTEVSGLPELVVSGRNGLLVPPEDPEAVAEALARLYGDPDFARALGRRGEAAVRERFDGDRLARELATLFREATA